MNGDGNTVAKMTAPPAVAPAGGKIVPVNRPDAFSTSGYPASTVGETPARGYKPGMINIFFLGINMTMCGQYMGWNSGLSAGTGTYIVLYFIMGAAYLTFCCCVAEVTSALPFAGGSYGLARCTLGFFPAFLIGSAETLEYTASVAVQAVSVSDILIRSIPSLESYKLLILLVVFYIPVTIIQIIGGAPFWRGVNCFAIVQIVLLLVHCFGVLGDVDFSANATKETAMFTGGMSETMHIFPFVAWFFLGVEALNLASDDVRLPKTEIPKGQIASICVLCVTGIFVLLTTVSLSIEGGIPSMAAELAPLDTGFMKIFNIDPALVTLLTLPSQYAGGYCSSWASAKLVHAMGASRLMPPWLASTSSRFGTPYAAILSMTILGYGICLLVHFEPSVTEYLLPLCLLFGFISYSGQCVGYISLKINYPIMKQSAFKNPFGIYGALFALAVWLASIIGILGFQGHRGVEAALFVVLMVVSGVYYVLIAKKRQIMSEEESKVLLVAHITRFNGKKSRRYTAAQGKASVRKSIVGNFLNSFRLTKPTASSAYTERAKSTNTDRG